MGADGCWMEIEEGVGERRKRGYGGTGMRAREGGWVEGGCLSQQSILAKLGELICQPPTKQFKRKGNVREPFYKAFKVIQTLGAHFLSRGCTTIL